MTEIDTSPVKIMGALGLATKAGRLVSGEFMTERAIKDGDARLVVIAGDASPGTKKKFTDSCKYYHVPIIFLSDKETLGKAVGKQMRASLAGTDDGFAKSIKKHLNGEVS